MMFKSLLTGVFLQLSVSLFAQSGDPAVVIRQVEAYGEKVTQVAFNGDRSPFGVVTVADAGGKTVFRVAEAELTASPNYFTLDLATLSAGDYVLTITTSVDTYEQAFKIQ